MSGNSASASEEVRRVAHPALSGVFPGTQTSSIGLLGDDDVNCNECSSPPMIAYFVNEDSLSNHNCGIPSGLGEAMIAMEWLTAYHNCFEDCDGEDSNDCDLERAGGKDNLIIHAETTTLMMSNIPSRYTLDELRGAIDTAGFVNAYDYLYMPLDYRSQRSLGYCFVNFKDTTSVPDFMQTFDGHSLDNQKVLHLSAAFRQGFLANVLFFSQHRHMSNSVFKPLVEIDGQLVPLDKDTLNRVISHTTHTRYSSNAR